MMHLGCAGQHDAEAFYCPDHYVAAAAPWLHGVAPPDAFPQPPPPAVRPNVVPV
jgi:hypothetical protein